MIDQNDALTRDGLIRMGLEGKDKAIGAYDEMLWKIRTGYAAVLYGTLTLVLYTDQVDASSGAYKSIGRSDGAFPSAGWKSATLLFILTVVVMFVGAIKGFWAGAAATVLCGGVLGVYFGIRLAFWLRTSHLHDSGRQMMGRPNGQKKIYTPKGSEAGGP